MKSLGISLFYEIFGRTINSMNDIYSTIVETKCLTSILDMENNALHTQVVGWNGPEATFVVASQPNFTIATYAGALNPFEAH